MKNLMKIFKKNEPVAVATTIPDAKEAFELTKTPQLKQCIREINDAIQVGHMRTYLGNHEKLHNETVAYLTAMGYDVKVVCYKERAGNIMRDRDEYFNEVFWGEGTTGKYTYEEK